MGIEMQLHLLDEAALHKLLDMEWNDLILGLENGTLRNIRPAEDKRLHRTFDIDCEAEILDKMSEIQAHGIVKKVLQDNKAHELLLNLMQYASPGYWEAWEGRCFIYLENAIGREIVDVDEMYLSEVWDEVRRGLGQMTENEYSQKVCGDWMDRRKALGETLDEKEDPRIIPTFEAHDRTSRTLHQAINSAGFVNIVGREHLPAADWGHEKWNLRNFLQASD